MKVIIKTKVLLPPNEGYYQDQGSPPSNEGYYQDQGSPPSYLMKVIIKTKVLLPRT